MNLRNKNAESIATFLDLRKDPNTGANAIDVLTNSDTDAKKIEATLEKLPEVLRVMSLDGFVPQDQGAEAEADRASAGRQGAQSRAQSGPDRCRAERPGKRRLAEGIGGSPAQDGRRRQGADAKGPGAVACRRLADALSKLAEASEDSRRRRSSSRRCRSRCSPSSRCRCRPSRSPRRRCLQIWSMPGRPRMACSASALPRGDPNDNDNLADRQRGSGGRADRDRQTSIDPEIRRHRGRRLGLRRHLCAGRDQPAVVAGAAADHRRAADPGAAGRGAVTLEICVLIRLPLGRQHRRAAAFARHRRRVQDLLRDRVAVGPDQSAAVFSLTRAIFFSALTTATAFGSLWLSSHPGTSSMGKLLALSLLTLAAVLLTSPALMGKPREIGE